MQGEIIRDAISNPIHCRSLTTSLALLSRSYLLPNPRPQVEVSPTSNNTTPENKLRGVDDHSEDIEFGLEDCSSASGRGLKERGRERTNGN